MATDTPIACTLTADAYRARLIEIAALSREALRHVEQRGNVVELRYAAEAAERVRRLVDQERGCCAFLSFELHEREDDVQVLVTVPPAAEAAVPELLRELTATGR